MLQEKSIIMFMAFLLLFMGVIFLIFSICMFYVQKKKIEKCTLLLKAKVVDVIQVVSTDFDTICSSVSWYPVYEYQVGSERKQKKSMVGAATKKYEIGEMVPLYVNPNHLDDFYEPNNNMKMIYSIFGVIGICMLIVSIILWIFK